MSEDHGGWSNRERIARALCALFFVAAGIGHFVIPSFYLAMMPPWLPAHAFLVQLSGVAEIAGGLGLLIPRVRRVAGIGLIVLLIAVFPANIQMLHNARAAGTPELGLWIRLPFQILLIWWVFVVNRSGSAAPAVRAQAKASDPAPSATSPSSKPRKPRKGSN